MGGIRRADTPGTPAFDSVGERRVFAAINARYRWLPISEDWPGLWGGQFCPQPAFSRLGELRSLTVAALCGAARVSKRSLRHRADKLNEMANLPVSVATDMT